jgi:hypothetical protein
VIPKHIDIGSDWDVLPPGIHDATILEVEVRFATNITRRTLFGGFKLGAKALKNAGCKTIFLDGSFVSEKPNPGDYDVCWDPVGVDVKKLDPVFLDFSNKRQKQKLKYCGEFFPSSAKADGVLSFVEYFQKDKSTRKGKGIIRIQLL